MTLLVLSGTSDARMLLEGLQESDVIASLAGVTRAPADLPAQTRIGGFGGVDGFRDYLKTNTITGVVDATHPFAAKMTETAATVCNELGVPHLILQRPGWSATSDDTWYFVDQVAEVADIIPVATTVFLGTGRQTLPEFSCLTGRHLLARVIDPPNSPFPFENGEFLVGTPPFTIAEEVALFLEKGIDWLVVKNAGGGKKPVETGRRPRTWAACGDDKPPETAECKHRRLCQRRSEMGERAGMVGRIIKSHDCVAEGAAYLAKIEPRFAAALELIGELPLRLRADGFEALLDAIVSQQISVAAANSIWQRLENARLIAPADVVSASEDDLRACGLSRPKIRYAKALAESGLDYAALRQTSTSDVIAQLVEIKGIGRWTAEIYAMFSLGRADVFAAGDLALQEAAKILFELPERPKEKDFNAMAEAWSPWRGVAARLLWAYYRVEKDREGIKG